MKIVKITLALVILLFLAGGAYLAFTDPPVQQKTVIKEIAHDPVPPAP